MWQRACVHRFLHAQRVAHNCTYNVYLNNIEWFAGHRALDYLTLASALTLLYILCGALQRRATSRDHCTYSRTHHVQLLCAEIHRQLVLFWH